MTKPQVGVVILTMGQRPKELSKAISSVLAQRSVELNVVVVGNGWNPQGLPAGVTGIYLEENVGIPAGRNVGAAYVSGDYLLFVDDDAEIANPNFVNSSIGMFLDRPELGLIQPRITDPSGKETPRRWIPRLRKKSATDSSYVFSVLEAVVIFPRHVFLAAGGWGDVYFYAHEGIEMAWRVWNTGKRVWYAGDLSVHHEVSSPTRHKEYYRLNARNRVWLAKRNLPWLLIIPYVLTWTGVQLIRSIRTGGKGLGSWLQGWFTGWFTSAGERSALSWKCVFTMAKYGRFPII